MPAWLNAHDHSSTAANELGFGTQSASHEIPGVKDQCGRIPAARGGFGTRSGNDEAPFATDGLGDPFCGAGYKDARSREGTAEFLRGAVGSDPGRAQVGPVAVAQAQRLDVQMSIRCALLNRKQYPCAV